ARALSDIGSSRLSWAGVIRTSWASTLTFSMPLVASRPLEGSAGVVVLDMVTTARDFRAGNNKPIPLWAFTGRRLQLPRFALPVPHRHPIPDDRDIHAPGHPVRCASAAAGAGAGPRAADAKPPSGQPDSDRAGRGRF